MDNEKTVDITKNVKYNQESIDKILFIFNTYYKINLSIYSYIIDNNYSKIGELIIDRKSYGSIDSYEVSIEVSEEAYKELCNIIKYPYSDNNKLVGQIFNLIIYQTSSTSAHCVLNYSDLILKSNNNSNEKINQDICPAEYSNINNNNYINWDDYFFGICKLSAMRSKDPKTKVGACIVDKNNRILSIGYNGFPIGCKDSEFPWNSESDNPLDKKDYYVVHAELNAILNYRGDKADFENSTMYTTLFPCNECAKAIIQVGIKNIKYLDSKDNDKETASKRMFDKSNVKYNQCTNNIDITINN